MRCRKASGKILASIVLVIVGLIVGVVIFSWDTIVGPSSGPSYHVVLDAVYFIEPVSVGNAKWEIGLIIYNNGKDEVLLRKLYVSRILVEEYGLKPGDSLSSASTIGSSLTRDGLMIKPNTSETIHVWIGSSLYSSGNQISLHIFNPDDLEYTKYIKLK
jgi:hypothetical protein